MVEALWAVYFGASSTRTFGAGVVVLETGRVFGGDGSYYYIGEYSVNGDIINVNLNVTHFAGPKNNVLVAGLETATLHVSGNIREEPITLEGTSPQAPGSSFIAQLKKLAPLP